MGSINITYAVVALAIALLFLLLGFFWGRSNVNSRVEDVLEKQRPALAAREFTLRQQLDDAIVEISRLRPVAEELARLKERLKNEATTHKQMEAEFSATGWEAAPLEATNGQAWKPQKKTASAGSADEAIKKLMQSLERFNEPVELSVTGAQQQEIRKVPQPQEKARAAPLPLVKEAVVPQQQEKKPSAPPEPRPQIAIPPPPAPRPQVSVPPPPEPRPQAVDEWQEFARSLAAYRKKGDPPTDAKKR